MAHRKKIDEFVKPSIPIVPMLDMSFQLMAFFLVVFNPTPPEGHLDLALPKQTGGPSTQIPSVDQPEEDDLTVQIRATPQGAIAGIAVVTKTNSEPKEIGADAAKLMEYLKARAKDNKPGKLRLECDETLTYSFVVQLIDVASRSGYKQVSPTLPSK
ncbi:MAG: ExbD/TolR family protein [Gemmataceae bacterium]